jgi:hypothetical protein
MKKKMVNFFLLNLMKIFLGKRPANLERTAIVLSVGVLALLFCITFLANYSSLVNLEILQNFAPFDLWDSSVNEMSGSTLPKVLD